MLINFLPFQNHLEKSTTVITVEDSKQGWAKAYRELLALTLVRTNSSN
jgi:hypothetical protein